MTFETESFDEWRYIYKCMPSTTDVEAPSERPRRGCFPMPAFYVMDDLTLRGGWSPQRKAPTQPAISRIAALFQMRLIVCSPLSCLFSSVPRALIPPGSGGFLADSHTLRITFLES